jgi:hypothetical protein
MVIEIEILIEPNNMKNISVAKPYYWFIAVKTEGYYSDIFGYNARDWMVYGGSFDRFIAHAFMMSRVDFDPFHLAEPKHLIYECGFLWLITLGYTMAFSQMTERKYIIARLQLTAVPDPEDKEFLEMCLARAMTELFQSKEKNKVEETKD